MQRRTVLPIAMALGLAWSSLRSQQVAPEAFQASNLVFDASIDYSAKLLTAAATFDLVNWTSHSARNVSFVLGRLMHVSSVRDAAGVTLPFTQDVVRFTDDPMRQVDQVVIRFPKPVAAGARTTVRLDYAGYIVPYSEIGWLYVRDHIDTAFTIIRTDALALPRIAGVNDKANRTVPWANFTYDASVRVPVNQVVATGGALTKTPNGDGTVTWRYRSGKPSPFLNIAVAPFDTLAGSGVRVFYFPEDSVGARQLMTGAQRALGILTESFGPLHHPLNVTITEIPNGWGSQADLIGGIIQTASAFRDTERLGELYHELSHLWNAVDTDTPSPRWNEGLAMFMEHVLRERVNAWPGRAKTDSETIARVKAELPKDSLLRVTPFIDYGKARITDHSYTVGDIMFSTLYGLVGPAKFNSIVGGYYQRFASAGTTHDFVDWAKRNSSHDLTQFFDDWLFTTRWTAALANATSIADLVAYYH